MPKKYIAEIINGDQSKWKNGDFVFIDSGTGTGKSHFVRNELTELANEQWASILFIFNRSELYEQNSETLYRDNNFRISIATYQEIEHAILNGSGYDFDKYKYIVCDECHYFTEDSTFNDDCDVSLNAILSLHNHVRILMSATGSTIFNYIRAKYNKNKIWTYSQQRDFGHISSLSFYNRDSIELVERFIEDKFPAEFEKVLWFCGSVKQAEELHNKYPNSSFMCSRSDSNKKYIQYLADDTIINENEKITFKGKYLFTTKVLDNGFDLIDPEIRVIVCDYFDLNTTLQCIGRKRMANAEDKVNIVLRNYSNQSIGGFKSTTKQILAEADAFINGGVEEWLEIVGKFGRKAKQIIMDNVSDKGKITSDKKLSRPKYLKTTADLTIINQILDENRELNEYREICGKKKEDDGYMQYIMTELKQAKCYPLETIYEKQDLNGYLNSIVGKMLFKDEQRELIDKMGVRAANGHKITGYRALNGVLVDMELNFIIESRVETKGEHRKKTYWIVGRITY